MTADPSASRRTAPSGDWDGLVVIQAATPWDGNPFQEHHLAVALSRLAPVLFVDPPMSVLTPLKRPERRDALRGPRLRLVRPNLARLTPMALPGMERPGMVHLTTALTRRAMREAVRALGGRVHAQIGMSTSVRTLGHLGERRKVYWVKDDMVGGADLFGMPAERIAAEEAKLAESADLIIATSADIAQRWQARGHQAVHIPPGYDDTIPERTDAAPLPADVDLPEPIAGFIGHLAHRIDLELLDAVAATGCSLLLVGPRHPRFDLHTMERLLARPNVRWVGPKPFQQLPTYLNVIDVGLVPYTDSAFNRGSFPLKTLEYLAAGCAVVATDLPAIRWLDTDLIKVAAGPSGYAAAVTGALRQPRDPNLVARRRAFAAAHTWGRRAEAFAAVLGIPVTGPARKGAG